MGDAYAPAISRIRPVVRTLRLALSLTQHRFRCRVCPAARVRALVPRGVDAMVRSSVKIIPAGVVALGTILATPAVGAAQSFRYVDDNSPSVVIQCGPDQRAVMEHRRINGETQVVARCEGAQVRGVVSDEHARAVQARPVRYATSRPAARRPSAEY